MKKQKITSNEMKSLISSRKQQIHIYHAIQDDKMFTEIEQQPRKYIGFIHAETLEQAYNLCQNDNLHPDYLYYNVRSLSVGDMLLIGHEFYMVCNLGFRMICSFSNEGEE
jgi:hypothetical protein